MTERMGGDDTVPDAGDL